MIEIDENNLPFVRTGQALLLLDLQNDFIESNAVLPVKNPPDFVENIVKLLPEFRPSGPIIFIRSIFETSRPFNELQGDSESLITDSELRPSARNVGLKSRATLLKKFLAQKETTSQSDPSDLSTGTLVVDDNAEPLKELEDDGDREDDEENKKDTVPETFLTPAPGQNQRAVLPASPGTNFAPSVGIAADIKRDLFGQKTYYSAFKDGSLVQTLRAKFVTEIYICGALTNISVFATAMDAARHGYAITILGDCLGYRSKARHDEALRRLQQFAGCEVISSTELIECLKEKAKIQEAQARRPKPQRPKGKNAGLEDLMATLTLKSEGILHHGSKSAGPSANVAEAGHRAALSDDTSESPHLLTVATATESPDKALSLKSMDVEGKKKERVKVKTKVRRRPSKSLPKEPAVPGDLKQPSLVKSTPSSSSANLNGASLGSGTLPTSTSLDSPSSASVGASKTTEGSPDLIQLVVEHIEKPVQNGGTEKDPKTVDPPSDLKAETDPESMEEGLFSLCEGDTSIIHNLLDEELEKGIFEKLRDEVRWQKMSHLGGDVPRLVVVQGDVGEDGSIPIYRHPADESPPLLPFSPTVSLIRAEVEKKLGHQVNHVLIQFYRDGSDYISEHSDKTLDIVPETFIANVSLGAQRTMVFRTKKPPKTDETVNTPPTKPREAVRAPLPHNSMCRMGLKTNMRWLHSIRQDKRPIQEKSPEELAYGGGRISLTFRLIGTFLDKDQQKIWGQGAVAKTEEEARTVINGKTEEAERMINAFGTENHSSDFDWKASYGEGFDVLHMSTSPKLFLSGDLVADLRVQLILAEYGIAWTEGKVSPPFHWKSGSSSQEAPEIPEVLPVKFVDSDLGKSTIIGDLAILLYLDAVYGPKANKKSKSPQELAKQYTRMVQSGNLLTLWKAEPFRVKPFRRELLIWEAYAKEEKFIAGPNVPSATGAERPAILGKVSYV